MSLRWERNRFIPAPPVGGYRNEKPTLAELEAIRATERERRGRYGDFYEWCDGRKIPRYSWYALRYVHRCEGRVCGSSTCPLMLYNCFQLANAPRTDTDAT